MTPTVRLELTTPGLEVRCAIQLRHDGVSHQHMPFLIFKSKLLGSKCLRCQEQGLYAWMWIRIRLDPYIFPDLELKRNIFPNLGSDLYCSLWGKNLRKKNGKSLLKFCLRLKTGKL